MIYLLKEVTTWGGVCPEITTEAIEDDGTYAEEWAARDPDNRSFKTLPQFDGVEQILIVGFTGGVRHP